MARKTGPSAAQVSVVQERAAGICERCGFRQWQQLHHRRPRGMGGTRSKAANAPSNLLAVCFGCHSEIEANRQDSLENGWLVRQAADPEQIPVKYRGTLKVLDNFGEVRRI
ncbi:HNH endonuclease [Gordonia phage Schmidt]|uniref:HNH endonuclease n=1 Tax=Gordonia phage Schmidt TaxID=2301697 RepID=A0A385E0D1_9CAUD|nr:HNH endonuclease [Gordonia phage Schmidt]AXQ65196.1 HNH endonuclease [Gordonia phage Schmidt]